MRGWTHQADMFGATAVPEVHDLKSFVEYVRARMLESYAGRDVTVEDVDRLVTERAVPIPPTAGAFNAVLEDWPNATPSGRTIYSERRGQYIELFRIHA